MTKPCDLLIKYGSKNYHAMLTDSFGEPLATGYTAWVPHYDSTTPDVLQYIHVRIKEKEAVELLAEFSRKGGALTFMRHPPLINFQGYKVNGDALGYSECGVVSNDGYHRTVLQIWLRLNS